MAVASLILSILWIGGLGAVLAIIFGFRARFEIKKDRDNKKGDGIALAGIIIGIAGILGALIFWIVVALVFSGSSGAAINPATSWCESSCIQTQILNHSITQPITSIQCTPQEDALGSELWACIPTLADGTRLEPIPVVVSTNGKSISIDGNVVYPFGDSAYHAKSPSHSSVSPNASTGSGDNTTTTTIATPCPTGVGDYSDIGIDWADCNLSSLDLRGINLTNANLSGVDLDDGLIAGCTCTGTNFTGANLQSATLGLIDLNHANFTNANLEGANFSSDDIIDNFLVGTIWSNTICPDGTNSDQDGGTCVQNLNL